ncbi:hypothetical protein [Marvinbryantia formatexigens]|nr:hypothetical protein [Marvinbryantia formatexigens]UWO26612.1 hypothetical protein NQ534_09210 [Marvinbryantia formatexigens DSM 14469]SDG47165.1 hypothetical protein SAMN05660368_02646 [Marvinbryantia formatexigens]
MTVKNMKALFKQLSGARYESLRNSLLASVVVFAAVYAGEWKLKIAPFILYFTSALFTAGIMWQLLNGTRHMETLRGMLMLPLENRSLVFSYITVLGAYALLTKTLPVWALFFAAADWRGTEIGAALLCGCMACAVTPIFFLMFRKRKVMLPVFLTVCILTVILCIRQTAAIMTADLVSMAGAIWYLYSVDAGDFLHTSAVEKTVRYTGRAGGLTIYLMRYLMADKSYCINTAGLCAAACFLPYLFGEIHGLNMLPFGFAVLCLNTPICTLLSADTNLEQAIRVLPDQGIRFFGRYCLFIFIVNGFVSGIYLCGWQLVNGGVTLADAGMAVLFALQSAVLSVLLEWALPIRSWKTESDLWHHPRKYLVPFTMLLLAGLLSQ